MGSNNTVLYEGSLLTRSVVLMVQRGKRATLVNVMENANYRNKYIQTTNSSHAMLQKVIPTSYSVLLVTIHGTDTDKMSSGWVYLQ